MSFVFSELEAALDSAMHGVGFRKQTRFIDEFDVTPHTYVYAPVQPPGFADYPGWCQALVQANDAEGSVDELLLVYAYPKRIIIPTLLEQYIPTELRPQKFEMTEPINYCRDAVKARRSPFSLLCTPLLPSSSVETAAEGISTVAYCLFLKTIEAIGQRQGELHAVQRLG